MKIGNYELFSIPTGFFSLDGGAMFGVVPKVLWNKTNPADELNRIKLAARSLLIVTENRKILIDTGLGKKFDQKFESIYNVKNISIEEALKIKNFNPDDITDVILTHLHFDHCGGSTKNENCEIVPVFKNAKYYIQHEHYIWAKNPSEKEKASFLRENFEPIEKYNQLELVDGEFYLDNNIKIVISNGHTPAQQHIKLTAENTTVYYCGDLIPTSSHIPYPYIMSYDLYPLTTFEEKKKLLPQAYEENWILFFEHDPVISSCTIKPKDKGFEVDKKNLIKD